MGQSVKRRINGIANKNDAFELRKLLDAALADMTEIRTRLAASVADGAAITGAMRNHLISDPALVIGTANKKTAKASKGFFYLGDGSVRYAPADSSMPLLTGAATAADKSTAYAFYVDSSAVNLSASSRVADAANAAAAIAAITAVAIPAGKILIGYLVVTMSGGATFTPNTTDLDAANTAVLYFSVIGPAKDIGAQTATAPAALTLEA